MAKPAEIPDKSILKKDSELFDYIDSYQRSFSDKEDNIDATKIGKLFFSSGPTWTDNLFAVRNKVVGLFGLKTPGQVSDRQALLDNFKCERGERLGLFKVFDKTENEVVLGEDDKHLNFRVSLFLDEVLEDRERKNLTITTTVKFNNSFGRLYFLPVRPFHKLIVPSMLNGIIRQIESKRITKE